MNDRDGSYKILLLGDLHFDAPKYHRREPANEVQKRGRLRNFAMWDGKTQDLLRDAASRLDDDTRWVIQAGDLSQGDGDDVELQTSMIGDAIDCVRNAFPGRKFLPVIGNHDLRLLDAFPRWNEYDENGDCTFVAGGDYRPIRKTLLPYIAGELGLAETPASLDYTLTRGGDLYIFVDPFKPGGATGFIRKALAEMPDARRVFIVSHLPLFPCEPAKAWAMWVLPDHPELLELLAPRHTILISGHTHYNHLIRYRHPEGVVTQLVLSSMGTNWRVNPLAPTTTNYADYAKSMYPFLEGKPPKIYPAENYLEHRTWRCFAEGKPSSATGYAMLKVAPDSVVADVYDGGSAPAHSLTLE